MFNEFFIKYGHIFFYICMIIVLCIVAINYCSCSSPTESDLSYITIQYHQSKIVGGICVYYIDYTSRGYEWSNYQSIATISKEPPGTYRARMKHFTYGKDFEWEGKKWRCKTVKRDYIEIAVY